MTPWGISRYAYEELRAFCWQYPEKKTQADMLLGLSGHDNITTLHKSVCGKVQEVGEVMPRGGGISDPTASTALKRDRYLADCDLIDRIARVTDGGGWEKALILNCCYRVGLTDIDPAILPSSHRNAFFQAKREFFFRLHEARNEFGTHGAIKT